MGICVRSNHDGTVLSDLILLDDTKTTSSLWAFVSDSYDSFWELREFRPKLTNNRPASFFVSQRWSAAGSTTVTIGATPS